VRPVARAKGRKADRNDSAKSFSEVLFRNIFAHDPFFVNSDKHLRVSEIDSERIAIVIAAA
jgi:hypothetical protein